MIFIGFTLLISYLPFNALFGFTPLPLALLLAVIGLTALYVVVTEIAKGFFYSRMGNVIA